MKNFSVKLYSKNDFNVWNAFIEKAKNATFLFHRDFMEYHKDRFEDYSLLIFDKKENLVSVLPANRVENAVFSHQGLTYGGFIFTQKTKLIDAVAIVKTVLEFLKNNQISKIQLKIIPTFYNDFPSDELEYCCFLLNAKLIKRDSVSVIDLKNKIKTTQTRKESINRGNKNQLVIKEETSFDSFWNEILIPNLENKHQVKPVHSLEEITLLKTNFSQNIKQFNVYYNDKIVAGTTMFITKNVAKPQYISGNEDKNQLGSLDFLYDFLIDKYKDKIYFDFGPSNEQNGKKVNEGIQFWKESFGARTMIQNFYEIETENYNLLENVMI